MVCLRLIYLGLRAEVRWYGVRVPVHLRSGSQPSARGIQHSTEGTEIVCICPFTLYVHLVWLTVYIHPSLCLSV